MQITNEHFAPMFARLPIRVAAGSRTILCQTSHENSAASLPQLCTACHRDRSTARRYDAIQTVSPKAHGSIKQLGRPRECLPGERKFARLQPELQELRTSRS